MSWLLLSEWETVQKMAARRLSRRRCEGTPTVSTTKTVLTDCTTFGPSQDIWGSPIPVTLSYLPGISVMLLNTAGHVGYVKEVTP